MHNHYQEIHQRLLDFKQKLEREREAWDEQSRIIDTKVTARSGRNLIWLDVGGSHQIKVSQELLCSPRGSLLERMFSNVSSLQRNRDGKIFLDRDGHTF
jgi:hypothetical protein